MATRDSATRLDIEKKLDSTLFVEAGAGTGKTTALVGRILSLIESGVDVRRIAAITFTEKAASELQMRVRQKLQEKVLKLQQEHSDNPHSQEAKENCLEALANLDSANISTLHSFAQQILTEHALAAELPLRFELLDPVASWVDFMDSWQDFLLNLDEQRSLAFQMAEAMEIRTDVLRKIAINFRDNWDLLEGYRNQKPTTLSFDEIDIEAIRIAESELGEAIANFEGQPGFEASTLKPRPLRTYKQSKELQEKLKTISVATASKDLLTFTEYIMDKIFKLPSDPSKETINDDLERELKLTVRDRVPERLAEVRSQVTEAVISYLAALLAKFTLDRAEARRQDGKLIFHDLLVLARNLFDSQNSQQIQESLHKRFQYLLIDEFQDTDPIQIDLTVRIAASVGQRGQASQKEQTRQTKQADWQDLDVEPGRLFFVGDPKQSIYRFRRADISLYLKAAKHFGQHGEPMTLTANWRSTPSIIEWVNYVFEQLIEEEPDFQSAYKSLEAGRHSNIVDGKIADDPGPPVASFGSAIDMNVDGIRKAEAQDVAKMILEISKEKWLVEDSKWVRPARLDDICILIPNRSALPFLETTFADARIPYRVAVSNQIFTAEEIRDLYAVLCAIDDPAQELMVVTALRSPAFGCGDDDLYAYHKAASNRTGKTQPSWNYLFLEPDSTGNAGTKQDTKGQIVKEALGWLAEKHSERNHYSVSQLVEKVIRERCLMELALTDKNYRDIWRRIRYFSDLARKFTDETGGTLGEFLALLRQLGENQIQLDENIVPESDHDAVRIMTIHASKGLEFPIVILANMPSGLCGNQSPGDVIWDENDEPGIHFKSGVASELYEQRKDDQDTHDYSEALRQLYVACTRARDHLVVSLHTKERDLPDEHKKTWTKTTIVSQGQIEEIFLPDARKQTWAETLARVIPKDTTEHYDFSQTAPPVSAFAQEVATSEAGLGYDDWEAEHLKLTEQSQKLGALSATAISNRILDSKKEPQSSADDAESSIEVSQTERLQSSTGEDAEEEAELEGNADSEFRGSSVGRGADSFGKATHAVLQSFDLTKSHNTELLQKLAKSQGRAFGIHKPRELNEICRLAEMAVRSESVREAASSPEHWKEVYVAAPAVATQEFEQLIYGYIDLAYLDSEGNFVILDFKTSESLEKFEQFGAEKARLQMAAYAVALEKATSKQVAKCVLVVLSRELARQREGEAHEIEIDGKELQKLKQEVMNMNA